MSRYLLYREYRDIFVNVWRKAKKLSKKQFKRQGWTTEQILHIIATGTSTFFQSLESIVLLEEEAYIRYGRRVFVPKDKNLLDMLWRSKMDIRVEDLESFHRCFTVSWPRNTVIDGVELSACLVWFGKS